MGANVQTKRKRKAPHSSHIRGQRLACLSWIDFEGLRRAHKPALVRSKLQSQGLCSAAHTNLGRVHRFSERCASLAKYRSASVRQQTRTNACSDGTPPLLEFPKLPRKPSQKLAQKPSHKLAQKLAQKMHKSCTKNAAAKAAQKLWPTLPNPADIQTSPSLLHTEY